LDSGRYNPPDLIVRTGGDSRHSGYYLFQSEYSEYAYTQTLWPDFTRDELDTIIQTYEQSKRNFGK
jgi:undecaprenyl diphosphate synthase